MQTFSMKKLPICILSLLVASTTALLGGCHTGQTDSGQSIKDEPKGIVINDDIDKNDENSPDIPDTMPETPDVMPELPDDDTLPEPPENEMPAPDDLPKPPEGGHKHRRHGKHGPKFGRHHFDKEHRFPPHKKPHFDESEPQEPLPDDEENPLPTPENGEN
jgi:hypothetical protein